MTKMNKYLLLITVLLSTCSCQLKHEPATQEILEAEIPLVCQNIKNIYVWAGKDFREYEVKKTLVSQDVCKSLNISETEAPLVSYLFDVDGNKTSYFLGLHKIAINADSVGFKNAQKVDPEHAGISISTQILHGDITGIYILALYQERTDRNGKYEIALIGDMVKQMSTRWKFHTFKSDEAFAGREILDKEYIMNFEYDLTSLFFHLEQPEKRKLFDGLKTIDSIKKMNKSEFKRWMLDNPTSPH